jgi:hypothetical protein
MRTTTLRLALSLPWVALKLGTTWKNGQLIWILVEGWESGGLEKTYHILSVAAEQVDGLRDVAVLAAHEHVVLFGADAGDEGQEGGEEEEAHFWFVVDRDR